MKKRIRNEEKRKNEEGMKKTRKNKEKKKK